MTGDKEVWADPLSLPSPEKAGGKRMNENVAAVTVIHFSIMTYQIYN